MATTLYPLGSSVDQGTRCLKVVMDYTSGSQPVIRLVDVQTGEAVIGLTSVDVSHVNAMEPVQEYGSNYIGTKQYLRHSAQPKVTVTLTLSELEIRGTHSSYQTPLVPDQAKTAVAQGATTINTLGGELVLKDGKRLPIAPGEIVIDGRNSFFSGNVRSTGKAEVTGIRGSSIDLAAADEAAFLPQRFYSDVKQYGAVGDGITDDTAALQAAIGVSPSAKTAKNKQEGRGKSVFRL